MIDHEFKSGDIGPFPNYSVKKKYAPMLRFPPFNAQSTARKNSYPMTYSDAPMENWTPNAAPRLELQTHWNMTQTPDSGKTKMSKTFSQLSTGQKLNIDWIN